MGDQPTILAEESGLTVTTHFQLFAVKLDIPETK